MNTALETERKIACTELARYAAHLNCGNLSKATLAHVDLMKSLERMAHTAHVRA